MRYLCLYRLLDECGSASALDGVVRIKCHGQKDTAREGGGDAQTAARRVRSRGDAGGSGADRARPQSCGRRAEADDGRAGRRRRSAADGGGSAADAEAAGAQAVRVEGDARI